jgi:Cys-tRNA(Pro)/Cys-tRNA(Cys) deacylase
VKTYAVRILDALGVPYTLRRFKATELSAEEAATALGVPLAAVVKTLVLQGDRTGVMRVCLPGTRRLSLKKLAEASGNKHVSLLPVEDLFRLTGYLRGGVSPLGGRRTHPVYCDESVLDLPRILINGGMRGLQIDLTPQALVRAAGAVVANLDEES